MLDLLKRPEGKTLEYKRDLSSPDGALKTIVAFANTAGGTLLIGAADRSRNVRGVSDGWILAERFAGSDKSRVLDRIEIHSFPVQAVEEESPFVQKHSWHGAADLRGDRHPFSRHHSHRARGPNGVRCH